MSTGVHIQCASGGNGRAVTMVTRAGCAAPTHRDLCIVRRERSTTERYCQMPLMGDGSGASSELRRVISSARAVCIPDAKMPEIILS